MRNNLTWLLLPIVCIIGLITFFLVNKPEDNKTIIQTSTTAGFQAEGDVKSGLPAESTLSTELSASNEKHTELTGPSPTDGKVLSEEHQANQLINAWRDAVIAKDPKKIEQLGLAVKGLGATSIPLLRKLALEDTDERIRAFATRILGRMRNPELTPFFRGLLESDKSPFVRENAAWALGELKDSQSINKLQTIAENDASEQVRGAAKKAIDTINSTIKK